MIHIIQSVCPDRHAIFGMAYDDADMQPAEAMLSFKQFVQAALSEHVVNPHCGICGSTLWNYEDAKTRFNNIQEARPFLMECEQAQAIARAVLGKY